MTTALPDIGFAHSLAPGRSSCQARRSPCANEAAVAAIWKPGCKCLAVRQALCVAHRDWVYAVMADTEFRHFLCIICRTPAHLIRMEAL